MRALAAAVMAVLLWSGAGANGAPARGATLQPFASDKALIAFVRHKAAAQKRNARNILAPPPMVMAPVAAPPPPAQIAGNDVVVTGVRAAIPSITNTQEADVDEGGIVKMHGNQLVVLRRGRLFTVGLDGGTMRPIDRIDAFPPGTADDETWYDEMLVAGDRVVVVGYSYGRGGTEINRFHIDANGRLRFEDSYHLRSNDYYSSSNYASRLIGNTLIFYTPLELDIDRPLLRQLPALSRWTGKANGPFERTAAATRIFVPAPLRRDPTADISTLHTVTTCDLAAAQLRCRATGVLGSSSRDFYVSGKAVYVWIDDDGNRAMVYRLPLDGSRPGAVRAWGGPVDQFSFREDRDKNALDILVRADSRGEHMWRSEVSEGDAALLHLPLASFGDGSAITPARAYRRLPLSRSPNWSFHNRFVGRFLVYSAGEFAGTERVKPVFVVPLDGGPIARLGAPHGVDRIDIIGSDAIVIGNDRNDRLGFSAIELAGDRPRLGDTYFLPAAREGERRSQAFFYRPDPDSADGASGTLGLPVTRDLGESPAARFLGSGSAVEFLRRDARRFSPGGELVAHTDDARDDDCKASCTDWYGNARPIFLGDRIFALMGYELVEGSLRHGKLSEINRVDFGKQTIQR